MLTPKGSYITVDRAEEPNANQASLPDYNDRASYRTRGPRLKPTMGLFVVFAVLAVGFLLVGYSVLAPVLEEWRWWVADNAGLFRALFAALVVSAAGAVIFALYSLGRFFYYRAQRSAITQLENGHPVAISDVTGGWQRPGATQVAMWTLEQHYAVQGQWANNSGLRGLGQYAPTLNTGSPAAMTGATVPLVLPGDAALDVAPVLPAEWLGWLNEAPHVLLAAETGGGKSTTAKKILEPRIMAGEHVYVVDPHSSGWFDLPSVGGGENWPQVRAALELVHGEYRRRIDERDAYMRETGQELQPEHFARLTVLLDEANLTRNALDTGKKGEQTPWMRFAQTLGSGARKVRISVILLAQSANVDDLGLSGPMRENFTRLALDTATIRRMLDTEERDTARRKLLYAAMVGREYPAAMERAGRVYLLDRTGVNHTGITSAARCAWAMGYEAMQNGAQSAEGATASHSIGHSAAERAVIGMFRRKLTYDQVREHCKRLSISIDQNRLPELRRLALGGE